MALLLRCRAGRAGARPVPRISRRVTRSLAASAAPPRPWEEDAAAGRRGGGATGGTVAIGCDHMARERKAQLTEHLTSLGFTVDDVGTHSDERCDYPVYAELVGRAVAEGDANWGVLVCGTGVGMCVAANKVPGVRAAVLSDTYTARMTRRHNNANVLCLGAWVVGQGLSRELVDAWAGSEYEGGRHQRRVDQISALESGGIPLARPPPTATEARPPRVITLGEILVEVMRPRAGMPLSETGSFAGPFPSGAPAIFIDAVARLGHGAAIVGAVGRDGFGENVLQRLEANGVCTALIDEVADLPTATAHVSYDHDGSRAVT